jgi:hypothetical protein
VNTLAGRLLTLVSFAHLTSLVSSSASSPASASNTKTVARCLHSRFALNALAVSLLVFSAALPSQAGTPGSSSSPAVVSSPAVAAAVHHDVSLPLRLLPPAPRQAGQRAYPAKPIPRPSNGGANAGAVDPVLQENFPTNLAPVVGLNFDGVGNGFTGPQGTFLVNSAPPDSNGDVGPTHYVQIVNTDFAVFNKSTGAVIYGPVPINTLWSGFGGGCQTNNDGDPVVLYDPIADRWVISQFSVSTLPYLQCVAVSTSGDPTGTYNRYSFTYNDFPDYPKMGVWPDAYYETFNLFAGNSFSGGLVCAYDRTKMLSGLAATQQCFNVGTNFGGLLPSDLDGTTMPPAGSPNYVLAIDANATGLAFWQFHVDWTTPGNSTLTGPTSIVTAPFSEACNGGTCIPQSGTTQQLDSLADRLMFRLAYRNFGDHESLVTNHSVIAGSSVGVRWYEIRSPGTAPTLYQQGTYAPDSNFRWMGSVAMDQTGNMALGFSLSSSSLHPAIHYTGRLAGDALGTMSQGEGTLINGAGSQNGNLTRWGDYSMMAVDPSDDCTFWYTTEYIPSDGSFNWNTRIGSFKLPGCGAVATDDFSISASPASLSLVQGASGTSTISTAVTSGTGQAVTLSLSGLPAGATASFNPSLITGAGSSTLTVNTGSGAAGTYSLTITGTGASATHTTSVTLTVKSASSDDFSISAAPNSLSLVQGASGTSTISTAVTSGSSETVSLSASGLPTGAAASFSLASVSTGQSSTLTLSTGSAAAGSYTITVTGTAASSSHSTSVAWIIASSGGGGASSIINGGFETGDLSGWTVTGTGSVVTGGHSGAYAAMVGGTSPTNGDSSIAQTFTAPAGATGLSFFYKVVCPDSLTYDWATATLQDNTAGTTATVVAKTCSNSGSWVQATAAVTAGHSYTLTLTSHDDNYTGDPTYTLYDDVALISAPPPPSGIVNGGFEAGGLSGWIATGASESVVSAGCHGGIYCALLGSTAPTNGDSSIAQTFMAPSGAAQLTFWYREVCPDTVTYDWATATLQDNTAGTTATVVVKACATTAWTQKTAAVTGGHSYTLTLTSHDDNYSADPTYTLFDDVTLDVGSSLVSTTTQISAPPVTYPSDATVTVSVTSNSGTPTGNVTLSVDNGPATSAALANGAATFTISSPSVGTHSLAADYAVQGNFDASSGTASLAVNNPIASTTSFTATPNPSSYGQTVTLTGTVTSTSGTPTGKVNFMDGAALLASVTLDGSGTATFTTSSLSVGTHSLQAIYPGDGSFGSSISATVSQQVNAPNDFSISASPNSLTLVAGNSGSSTISTAVISGSAGTVNLSVSGAPAGASASLNLTSVTAGGGATLTVNAGTAAAGNYTLTITGTEGTMTHSTTVSLTVTVPPPNDFSISANPNSLSVAQGTNGGSTISTTLISGSAQTIAFSMSGLPTGANAVLSPASVSTGQSSALTISAGAAAPGVYSISVTGTSSSFSHSTSLSLTITGSKLSSMVQVTSSLNPALIGQSVTYTATVASSFGGTPTGTVKFQQGGVRVATVPLSGGVATYTTSYPALGVFYIKGVYSGDTQFSPSTSAVLKETVSLSPVTVSVAADSNPSTYGQSVTFTATLSTSGPSLDGQTVVFSAGPNALGSAPISGGVASVTTSALNAGMTIVKAVYAGDSLHHAASGSLPQKVTRAVTTLALASSADPSPLGQDVTFTATVSSPIVTPTGTVTFKSGNTLLGTVALSGGVASVTTNALSAGSHLITATYSNSNFTNSSSSLTEQVH